MMKKKLTLFILSCIVSLTLAQAAAAHGLVYETKTLPDNQMKITLKWSKSGEAKGIVISYFYLENGKTLNIGYELKDKAPTTATFDFDLKGAVLPLRIIIHKTGNLNWLPFNDIKNIEAVKSIWHLHDAGVIDAGSSGKFRPNDNITRAEFADILCKALKLGGKVENTQGLKDIAKVPEKNSILLVVKKGFLSGYKDKTFKPQNSMTVAEMCTSISKAFAFKTVNVGYYKKLKKDKPYYPAVKKLFDAGILSVNDSIYTKFNEESKISRANAVLMISRALTTQ